MFSMAATYVTDKLYKKVLDCSHPQAAEKAAVLPRSRSTTSLLDDTLSTHRDYATASTGESGLTIPAQAKAPVTPVRNNRLGWASFFCCASPSQSVPRQQPSAENLPQLR
jgi:hypothetical protein